MQWIRRSRAASADIQQINQSAAMSAAVTIDEEVKLRNETVMQSHQRGERPRLVLNDRPDKQTGSPAARYGPQMASRAGIWPGGTGPMDTNHQRKTRKEHVLSNTPNNQSHDETWHYILETDRWTSPSGNVGYAVVEGRYDGGPGALWFEWESEPSADDQRFYFDKVHPELQRAAWLIETLSAAKRAGRRWQ